MCGINGFLSFTNNNPIVMKNKVEAMNLSEEINDTVFFDSNCAFNLGQVLSNQRCCEKINSFETKKKIIVLCGQVYNYLTIKELLIEKEYKFKEDSMSEVVLYAYNEYKEKFLDYLNGSFVIVIWNKEVGELLIARDRLGKNPLYYLKNNENLIFSSQLKNVAYKSFSKQIDYDALANFLRFYYIPAPKTIYKNIYKLLPGYYLKVNVHKKKAILKKYWDINKNSKPILSYEQCKSILRNRLTQSVQLRMHNGLSTGAFLSGGIDSSIVVGLMSRLSDQPIDTFTIGYKDNRIYDESNIARKVAEHNNTNHHELFLDFTDLNNIMEELLESLDEPFADSSSIPTYFVSKLAKENVQVALAGDGGDELFAGYNKYTSVNYSIYYRIIPQIIREQIIKGISDIMPSNSNSRLGTLNTKIRKFLRAYDDEPSKMHTKLMESLSVPEINKLVNFNFDATYADDEIKKHFNYLNTNDLVEKMMYTDLNFALPNDMLVKVGRMSELNSLIVKSPFLDKEVIEFAFQIPRKFKMKGNQRKIILKDTFNEYLPNEVLNSPKKGFGIPIGEWFKKDLKELLLDILSKKNIDRIGLFNYSVIENILRDHFNEQNDNANILWSLLVFHYWYQNNV